jgi:hypothetical protein
MKHDQRFFNSLDNRAASISLISVPSLGFSFFLLARLEEPHARASLQEPHVRAGLPVIEFLTGGTKTAVSASVILGGAKNA